LCAEETFSFLFTPSFEDFSAAQPFLLQQVNNQLVYYCLFIMHFLPQGFSAGSRTLNTRLFLFFSELMDLFVAGQYQSAAVSQTTWLQVTPP
jgi:hypothetical protein